MNRKAGGQQLIEAFRLIEAETNRQFFSTNFPRFDGIRTWSFSVVTQTASNCLARVSKCSISLGL